MDDKDQPKDPLPGNHGQFGVSDATEEYKPLDNQPAAPSKPGDNGSKQTNAGERS